MWRDSQDTDGDDRMHEWTEIVMHVCPWSFLFASPTMAVLMQCLICNTIIYEQDDYVAPTHRISSYEQKA